MCHSGFKTDPSCEPFELLANLHFEWRYDRHSCNCNFVMLPINWKNFQAFWAHGLCISIAGLYQPFSELNIFDEEKFQSSQHKETALGHLHEYVLLWFLKRKYNPFEWHLWELPEKNMWWFIIEQRTGRRGKILANQKVWLIEVWMFNVRL